MNLEQETKWNNDPKNWKFFGIYYNPNDPRIVVPKAIPWMGVTLNFANPKSYLVIITMLLFFGFIIYMIDKNN